MDMPKFLLALAAPLLAAPLLAACDNSGAGRQSGSTAPPAGNISNNSAPVPQASPPAAVGDPDNAGNPGVNAPVADPPTR
jgi:hypothetical protein